MKPYDIYPPQPEPKEAWGFPASVLIFLMSIFDLPTSFEIP